MRGLQKHEEFLAKTEKITHTHTLIPLWSYNNFRCVVLLFFPPTKLYVVFQGQVAVFLKIQLKNAYIVYS